MRPFLLFVFTLFCFSLFSQQTEDAVVELTAITDPSVPSVTLIWNTKGSTDSTLLIRREKGDNVWYLLDNVYGLSPNTFVDALVNVGKTYEYAVRQGNGGVFAFGYNSVPVEYPLVEDRGKILVFVEEALQMPLAMELSRLEQDLVGDGWKVAWYPVSTDATVESVKTQIVADYQADQAKVKSVFLFGEIPVPYSGNTAWDAHGDHQGAWVADTYYADMDGVWTDNIVNNTSPSRAANDNVPGDGKFDQSITPTSLEVAVGRVDFSNLSEATFGTSRTELYRRYLDKNHRWRTKQYVAEKKALVDDNFGYFGGEAFAANGYRNFYPLVGADNVEDGDFFSSTDSTNYLFAYGCGGGSYTSASGVGNSTDFANDSVNAVFTMLFGSYHGDWDSENNPFMMSALASKGGILSCSWAGRPHWFYHPIAAGETLGDVTLMTQNTCDIAGYFGTYGQCGAHVTLLGDPTLRAHVVAPVTAPTANVACKTIDLEWKPSNTENLLGYHVYRSDAMSGEFTRLTSDPLGLTFFTDDAPLNGPNVYQIRAVAMEVTESGFYENASTGVFISVEHTGGVPPSISATSGVLTCDMTDLELVAISDAGQPDFTWTLPDGNEMNGQTINISMPGIYEVNVVDETTSCSNSTTVEVSQDIEVPQIAPTAGEELNCLVAATQLSANPSTSNYSFQWTGANGFVSDEESPTVSIAGVYELIASGQNGCTVAATVTVHENFEEPSASPTADGAFDCTMDPITLFANPQGDDYAFLWTGSNGFSSTDENVSITEFADYELTVTGPNGCSATFPVTIPVDNALPTAEPSVDGVLSCTNLAVQLLANASGGMGLSYSWAGPNGFASFQENPVVSKAGSYLLTVTASNGCTATASVEVESSADVPVITFGPAGTFNCTSTSLVLSATVSPNGDYEVLWTSPTGAFIVGETTLTPEVASCGIYTLTVTDMTSDCSESSSITVDCDFTIPDLAITGETHLPCFGMEATLTATSNTAGATIEWQGQPDPSNPVQIVPLGQYSVIVSAPNGCTNEQTIAVTSESPIEITMASVVECDGSMTPSVSGTGGVPPYTFFISPDGPIPPNTPFEITVMDANGCEVVASGVTPMAPDILSLEVSHTNESVLGFNDGSATAVPSGGVPPYTYEWSNGATNQTITGLAPGIYTVTITDGAGCEAFGSVEVLEGIVADREALDGLVALEIFPNPTSGRFQVALELDHPIEAALTIFDPTGRAVWQSASMGKTANHSWQPDLSGLAAGGYFCEMRLGGQLVVKRIVLD